MPEHRSDRGGSQIPDSLPRSATRQWRVLALHAMLLALGIALLAAVMYRPLPHLITQWNDHGSWLAKVSDAAPDSVAGARLWVAIPLGALVAVHVHLVWKSRTWSPLPGTLAAIVVIGVALAALLSMAKHSFSGDVYSYIMYGRVAAVHGSNPMLVTPDQFPDDPFLSHMTMNYRDTVSVYGPIWVLLSVGATRLAEAVGGDLTTYVVLYRLVCLAGYAGSVVAVWALASRWRPNQVVSATLTYALCPLTVVELSAIHNDFVMMGLIGAGFVLADRRRVGLAVGAITAAALVKWIAVVPMVFVVVAALSAAPDARRRWGVAGRALLACVLVTFVAFAPFSAPVRSSLSPFSQPLSPTNSLVEFGQILIPRLLQVVGINVTLAELSATGTALAGVTTIGALLVGTVYVWKCRAAPTAAATSTAGALLAITLVAPRFWPWYALWSLMLAPFCPTPLRRAIYVLSATALLVYVLYPVSGDLSPLCAVRALVVILPVVATLLMGSFLATRHPLPSPA